MDEFRLDLDAIDDEFLVNVDGNDDDGDVDLSEIEQQIEDAKQNPVEGESLEERLEMIEWRATGDLLFEQLHDALGALEGMLPLVTESMELTIQYRLEDQKHREELNALNEGYEKTKVDLSEGVQAKTEQLHTIKATKDTKLNEFKDRQQEIREKFRKEREQNRQKLRDALHESNRPEVDDEADKNNV